MKAKAKTDFLHDQLGSVREGAELEVTAEQAASIADCIDVYETKVVRPQPVDPEPRKGRK